MKSSAFKDPITPPQYHPFERFVPISRGGLLLPGAQLAMPLPWLDKGTLASIIGSGDFSQLRSKEDVGQTGWGVRFAEHTEVTAIRRLPHMQAMPLGRLTLRTVERTYSGDEGRNIAPVTHHELILQRGEDPEKLVDVMALLVQGGEQADHSSQQLVLRQSEGDVWQQPNPRLAEMPGYLRRYIGALPVLAGLE